VPERVLLLGDDLRAFLAIARSLGRRGIEVHAAPSDFSSPALKSRYIAAAHRLPPYPLEPAAWEAALGRLIATHDFRFVVPTSDSGLFMLRHHAETLGRERIAIANEAALAIFTDKAATRALAEAHGVPVANGMSPGREANAAGMAAALGLPLVLKPRTSYALGDVETKRSARIVRTADELDTQLRSGAWTDGVAESFFPGIGIGVSVLARDGRILAIYQHRRLHEGSETGASTKRVSETVDPALLGSVEPLAAATRLDGVAMFEFRVDRRSRRHILLEVNPRFWGSLPLAVAAGADFPALWWDMVAHGRECGCRYAAGIVKADLTGEFDRAADRVEDARGLARLGAAAAGLAAAAVLLLARRGADSWAADDLAPWRAERRSLAARVAAALVKRLPGRRDGRSTDAVRRLAARPGPLRLLVIGRENVCRSPFAEQLLRRLAPGVEVRSAGLLPLRGAKPAAATIRAAAAFGVDLSGHVSEPLSLESLDATDGYLLLDEDSLWRLRQIAPGFAAEVVRLPDFVRREDILETKETDPAEAFGRIEQTLIRLADELTASRRGDVRGPLRRPALRAAA
jgi:protein-tyrosine-phosphatase/predicted ATP-grasp superfamily ATP-dependent carboligase